MVDSLRRGGFGLPGGGVFRTGGSLGANYLIGDDGSQAAYLDKLTAQTKWHNGLISDEAYVAALRKYVNSTEKGTTQRVSAEKLARRTALQRLRGALINLWAPYL